MGEIMHEGESYSRQMVVDSALSSVSNNPVKNRILKALFDALDDSIGSLADLDTTDKSSLVDAINELVADETVLKKTLGTASYGNIDDFNFINNTVGVRYYTVSTTANHAPTTGVFGYLIDITHLAAYAMQIFIPNNPIKVFMRTKTEQDWPTTGSYGWQSLIEDSGYKNIYYNQSTVVGFYRKVNGVVELQINGYVTISANSRITLTTVLPEEYRSRSVSFPMMVSNGTLMGYTIVREGGTIDITNNTSSQLTNAQVIGTTTFLAN